MYVAKIPKKKKGEYRILGIANRDERIVLRAVAEDLNKIQQKVCNPNIVFGFMPQKNIVLNARKHIGYKYTLNLDLKDFFNTVTIEHVKEYLNNDIISKVFIPNPKNPNEIHAWQGLSTSPAVANIAAAKMDNDILNYIKTLPDIAKSGQILIDQIPYIYSCVYTRYADDLSFSFNNFEYYNLLLNNITNIIEQNGFKLNINKIRLQDARFGLREVTSIKVGENNIYISKKFKRKIRAAKYKNNKSKLHGLQEFAKLKSPHQPILIQLANIKKHILALINQCEFQLNLSKLSIEEKKNIINERIMFYKEIIYKINSIDNKYSAKVFIRNFLNTKDKKYKEELAMVSNILKKKSDSITDI